MIKLDTAEDVQGSLKLLLKHARGDTGGSRRCASFLLSLWNGDIFKADLQDLMHTDADIFTAMMRLFQYLFATNQQLDSLITEAQIKPVLALWGDVFKTTND